MAPGNLKPSYNLLRDLLSRVVNPHRHILIHKTKQKNLEVKHESMFGQ